MAAELGLPLFNRDGLKELLFDTLGWSDRVVAQAGVPGRRITLHVAERVLAAKMSPDREQLRS